MSARFLLALFLGLSGCATPDRNVTMLYKAAVGASGGSGELYLSSSAPALKVDDRAPVQWLVGSVTNNAGEKTGDIASKIPPQQVVLDALKQELVRAGYTVTLVDTHPSGEVKGVDLTAVSVHMQEVGRLTRSEVNARIAIAVVVRKEGREARKLGYEAKLADYAVAERSQLPLNVLQSTLQGLMEQAIPEIISALER